MSDRLYWTVRHTETDHVTDSPGQAALAYHATGTTLPVSQLNDTNVRTGYVTYRVTVATSATGARLRFRQRSSK